MPEKERKKERKKDKEQKVRTGCKHEYIRTDGIITCSHCPMRAIQYLTPLKNK